MGTWILRDGYILDVRCDLVGEALWQASGTLFRHNKWISNRRFMGSARSSEMAEREAFELASKYVAENDH